MKCPKCGSEHIQYATSTSGGGFSVSDSCCGFILLGPLGLLCGACGSGTTTKEFWICQDCGAKFSNESAKQRQSQENADKDKFLQYTAELSAVQSTEGDFETIRSRFQEMSRRAEEAQKQEDDFIKSAAESSDETIVKLAKAGKLQVNLGLVLLALSIIALLLGAGVLTATVLLVGFFLMLIAGSSKKDAARKQLMGYNHEFCTIASEVDFTKSEAEKLKKLVEKIDFVERHQPIE